MMENIVQQEFKATVQKIGNRIGIVLPFDPDQIWGASARHDVHGVINLQHIRGKLEVMEPAGYMLSLGPAWRRDSGIGVGHEVTVVLAPEGPGLHNMAEDIVKALQGAPDALAFFNSLPTFYRKNYMRWIDSAKRPETRANRIAEMVELLQAGKREK